MELIAARGLAVGHRGRPLARDISLSLRAGETLCLLGPNGAGKTTILRTLLGLIPALGGSVSLGGTPMGELSRAARARRLAYVPQAMTAPFADPVRAFVLQGRTAHLGLFAGPGPADRAAAEAALAQMGIAHLAETPVTRLSGGQRQMVLIARALAQAAPAILLDEPAASLDFGNRERLLARLEALARQGLGLVISTHEPGHAVRLADRVLTVDASGRVASGPPGALLTAEHLGALYDLPPETMARALAGQG
ncbi:ABC transporter ATP-binding protein (plasmid) [Paroceanicella profunda]|uniref:ABC transporter ATP-binding protein n=1 Tax=Paroceanicella profunda TaxID=2579971 RepID=A0A5B8G556_9RHOB|nr:ABC transporter ATP-binding protein [Paroceanicella profunda]QDL94083.1 ABC transporter ATP-binding protein [Paroceanicella profunda]